MYYMLVAAVLDGALHMGFEIVWIQCLRLCIVSESLMFMMNSRCV